MLYADYSNSTFSLSGSTDALTELNVNELFFLALSIFFLYFYLRLLRWKVPNIVHLSASSEGFVEALSSLRKWPKRSGLTHADIENRLKSFSVEIESHSDTTCRPLTAADSGYCEISFGQESCAICLDGYCGEEDSLVRQLPCDHVFHQGSFRRFATAPHNVYFRV